MRTNGVWDEGAEARDHNRVLSSHTVARPLISPTSLTSFLICNASLLKPETSTLALFLPFPIPIPYPTVSPSLLRTRER